MYVDNYLEGFHIPFVHPGLNEALDYGNYEYLLFDHGNLQLGVANDNEICFAIPKGEKYSDQNIYAFYFWMFPNIMLNFYPWGMSLNQVIPIAVDKTLIKFRSFVLEDHDYADNDAMAIHQTEMEDEKIVMQVQKGVRSRYYDRGRYSPTMEKGLHQFHMMLSEKMRMK